MLDLARLGRLIQSTNNLFQIYIYRSIFRHLYAPYCVFLIFPFTNLQKPAFKIIWNPKQANFLYGCMVMQYLLDANRTIVQRWLNLTVYNMNIVYISLSIHASMFPGITTDFGQPSQNSSWSECRPWLNWFYHFFTVLWDGA